MRFPSRLDPPADAIPLHAEGDRAASEVQRNGVRSTRTAPARAECEARNPVYGSNGGLKTRAGSTYPDPANPGLNARSAESIRSERGYAKIASRQQTQSDRLVFAGVLLALLKRHGVSHERFGLMVDINEKTVRKMLAAEVSIPMHILLRMEGEMRDELIDEASKAAGSLAVASPGRMLARIERDRDFDALDELEDATREVGRRMRRGR